MGSFSVRLYSGEKPQFPTDHFVAGVIHKRDGVVENVARADVDGDGSDEILVIVRSVGTASYLSAHAFAVGKESLVLQASVADLDPEADIVSALKDAKTKKNDQVVNTARTRANHERCPCGALNRPGVRRKPESHDGCNYFISEGQRNVKSGEARSGRSP